MQNSISCNHNSSLPSYNEIYKTKLIKGKRFIIKNYGISNHYWSIYKPRSNKPILKYYSTTNHESSTLCDTSNEQMAKVTRKTFKGEGPRYNIELFLNQAFYILNNIKITLNPYPKLECTDIDNHFHEFQWIKSGKFFKKLKLIRKEDPNNILATFTYDSIRPFIVGQVEFQSEMSDNESVLLLLFLTFVLYNEQIDITQLKTNTIPSAFVVNQIIASSQ